MAAFNHVTPFPGTPLYAKLEAEGRLYHLDADWAAASRRGRLIAPPAMMYVWNQEGIKVATRDGEISEIEERKGSFLARRPG